MVFILICELRSKYIAHLMLLFAHTVFSTTRIELTFYLAIVLTYAIKTLVCVFKLERIAKGVEQRIDPQYLCAGYVSLK